MPMPWFRVYRDLPSHPKIIRLGRKLKARGVAEPEAVALASYIAILCMAASYAVVSIDGGNMVGSLPFDGDAELDETLGRPGMAADLVSVHLLDENPPGRFIVHDFATRNAATVAKLLRDQHDDRVKKTAPVTGSARRRDGSATSPRRVRDEPASVDGDGDGEQDEDADSCAPTSSASPIAAPVRSDVPCGSAAPLPSNAHPARTDVRCTPVETSLFDDMTMTGPPVTQDAPVPPDATVTAPVAAKRAKSPRKRADGTAPDSRIPEVIRGWEAAYLDRCRIPAPKLSPKAAAQEFGAIGTLIRRIDPSMTGADIVGLLDHALMLAQGSDYEAGKWRGMPLRALLSDANVAKLRLSKATHERTVARSWSAEGVG